MLDSVTPPSHRSSALARLVASPATWTVGGLVFSLLPMIEPSPDASPFWWLLPILFSIYLVRWAGRDRWRRWRPRRAVAAYLLLACATGVAYELTLSEGGLGGLAPDTATSFALLPGYLVPAVVFTWWMTWRYQLNERRLFFLAGVMAWYEAVTVGAGYVVSTPLVAPILVAFYLSSYAVYNGALGLLVIDPTRLWADTIRPLSTGRLLLAGVAGGAACWLCFVAWAQFLG